MAGLNLQKDGSLSATALVSPILTSSSVKTERTSHSGL